MDWDSHTSSWQMSTWLPLSICKACHLLVVGGQPFGPHLSVLGDQEMETACSSAACAGAYSPSLLRHPCPLPGEAALISHEPLGWLPCQCSGAAPARGILAWGCCRSKRSRSGAKCCYSECSYPVLLAVINIVFSQVPSCWVPQMNLSALLFPLLGRVADLTVHLAQMEVVAIKI